MARRIGFWQGRSAPEHEADPSPDPLAAYVAWEGSAQHQTADGVRTLCGQAIPDGALRGGAAAISDGVECKRCDRIERADG